MGSTARPDDRRIGRETGIARRVVEIIEPSLGALGIRLVSVRLTGANGQTLQIMAERPDGTMRIEDCELVSRTVSPLLDVEDPVAGAYHLEVSSPGIDRLLVRPEDFERWAGHLAKVEMETPIAGRKRFQGVLEGFDGTEDEVRLFIDSADKGGEDVLIGLPFGAVAKAKLVMTDALLDAARDKAKAEGLADGSAWDDAGGEQHDSTVNHGSE